LNVSEIHNPDIMVKSPSNKIKIAENFALGIADVLLVYSMLSPIILLIIGAQIKLVPNFLKWYFAGIIAGFDTAG